MKIRRDKVMHFVTGVIGGCGFGLVLFPAAGLGIVAVVAALKEMWGYMGHGTPEAGDFAASLLGGVVGAVIADAARLSL